MNIADAELKIGKLVLGAGDMLVVQMPIGADSHENMVRVHGQLRHILHAAGLRVGVLVFPHGTDLAVLTRAEIEKRS